jgi:hypothetical protein
VNLLSLDLDRVGTLDDGPEQRLAFGCAVRVLLQLKLAALTGFDLMGLLSV